MIHDNTPIAHHLNGKVWCSKTTLYLKKVKGEAWFQPHKPISGSEYYVLRPGFCFKIMHIFHHKRGKMATSMCAETKLWKIHELDCGNRNLLALLKGKIYIHIVNYFDIDPFRANYDQTPNCLYIISPDQ